MRYFKKVKILTARYCVICTVKHRNTPMYKATIPHRFVFAENTTMFCLYVCPSCYEHNGANRILRSFQDVVGAISHYVNNREWRQRNEN